MRLLVATALLLISITTHATEFRIFEQAIKLRGDCSLEIKHSDGTVEVKELPFKTKNKCVVLPLGGTNVPRLEFIQGDYVFLVESQVQTGKACRAELVAIITTDKGKVMVATKTQKTGVCGYGERKDFEILHHHTISNAP